MRKLAALFLLLSPSLWAQDAYLPRNIRLEPKSILFEFFGQQLTSTQRVDSDGDKQDFSNGENFSQMKLALATRFAWTENVELAGGVDFVANQSVVYDSSLEKQYELSQSGVNSVWGEFDYYFKKSKKWYSSLAFSYRQYAYTNPPYDEKQPYQHLVLGDGGRDLRVSYRFYYTLEKLGNGFEGSLSLVAPSELSTQLRLRLFGIYGQRAWSFMSGLELIKSIGRDEYQDNPSSKPPLYRGSTYLFNSINQERLSVGFKIYHRLSSRWRVGAFYFYDLQGQSTDLGHRVGGGLSYFYNSHYSQKQQKGKFKNYNIQATVEKMSSQKNYVVINKGYVQGVHKGDAFDFFHYDYKSGNSLLARGQVVRTQSSQSIVKIKTWYTKRRNLQDDVIARGGVN